MIGTESKAEDKTMGNGKDDDSKDDGGQHREEDNTADGSHDRPIPPPHEPNRHDR